jgi:hypothetical protein
MDSPRPWYQRKRYVIPAAALLFIVVANIANGDAPEAETAQPSSEPESSPTPSADLVADVESSPIAYVENVDFSDADWAAAAVYEGDVKPWPLTVGKGILQCHNGIVLFSAPLDLDSIHIERFAVNGAASEYTVEPHISAITKTDADIQPLTDAGYQLCDEQ